MTTLTRDAQAAPGPPTEVTVVDRPDVRLLLPAAVTWAVVALAVGHGPRLPAALAVVAVLLGVAGVHRSRPQADDDAAPVGRACGARPGPRGRSGAVARGRSTALTALLCGACLVTVAGAEARDTAGPVTGLAAGRSTVRVVGRVAGEPRLVRAKEAGPDRVVTVLRVQRVEAGGVATTVHTPILVLGDASWRRVGWGDTVTAHGRLVAAEPGRPTRAVLQSRGAPDLVADAGPVVEAADRARDALRRAVQPLPEDARGLVPAMIIGDREGVPDDLTDAMNRTGLSHLTAVSGTNCSLVVAAALWLCGLVHLPRWARPLAGGMVLAAFVVLARPDPSVVRAAVMGAIGLLGILRSRRAVALPALSGAILVLLAVDPWLARSFSFALSVLATLGLVLLARPWGEALRRRAPWLGPLAPALAVPLAAQTLCLPVLVVLQGEINVVGVLTNLAAAPLVAPVTMLAAAAVLVAPWWTLAATGLAWIAAVPATGIALVARVGEHAPLRAVPWPDGPGGAVGAAALVLAVLLTGPTLLRRADRHRGLAVGAGVVAVVLLVPFVWVRRHSGFPGEDAAAVMCDVGQGDAIVLPTGPHRAVVVDAGPDPDLVDRCLDRIGVQVVDAVVLTHFDQDHVGGVEGVSRGRRVGDVVVSTASLTDVRPGVRRWWEGNGRPIHPAAQGDRFAWGQVTAVVRGPRRTASSDTTANAGSLVLDVVVDGPAPHDEVRLLLLADADEDAGRAVADDLLRDPRPPAAADGAEAVPVDVVKIAHHGSAHHDPGLLRQVAAPLALVSVGEGNRYGHPAPSLLRHVDESGSTVRRTDRDGSIAVTKKDGVLGVRTERS